MQFRTNRPLIVFSAGLAILLGAGGGQAQQQKTAATVDPYAINNGQIPSKAEYDGPLWRFNHAYPQKLPNAERRTAVAESPERQTADQG